MMTEQGPAFHYVCTRAEAWNLVQQHDRFWVSNCGCREQRGHCSRSRIDVCLAFRDSSEGSEGSGRREITLPDVERIFGEARNKHLVARPFRNDACPVEIDGICFCCDDCCGYFLDADEVCDRGDMIEQTNVSSCTDCGACADVCYFDARRKDAGVLARYSERCYGCGLCADVCPEHCITMVPRR